jgi:hypothetical protein
MRILFIASALLIPIASIAKADDHLFQAQQHGLSRDSRAFSTNPTSTTNRAGHSGDLAPGQGSPFTGDETKTPATDTTAANQHATVKERASH